MNTPAPIANYLKRALSSLVAIIAVSSIFGAKAYEVNNAIAKPSAEMMMAELGEICTAPLPPVPSLRD